MSRAYSLKQKDYLHSKSNLVGGHIVHTVTQPYKKDTKTIDDAPPEEVTMEQEKREQEQILDAMGKAFAGKSKPKKGRGLKTLE